MSHSIENELVYLRTLQMIMEAGTDRPDRTGVGTRGVFGHQMRFNLEHGFPLLTTKTVNLNSIIHELLWFLSGDTNIAYLKKNKVHIWDEWATAKQTSKFGREAGDLGPVYGHQWRNFGATRARDTLGYRIPGYERNGVDQILKVVQEIQTNPMSRRLIVTGWNPKEADEVTLPPCHTIFQFYVSNGKLSCHLYQRSGDMFLGVPYNIASYALLTMMIAQVTKYTPGEFIHSFGDAHIYKNHFEQVKLQLSRDVKDAPKVTLNPEVDRILEFTPSDIVLSEYEPHPPIHAPVAV